MTFPFELVRRFSNDPCRGRIAAASVIQRTKTPAHRCGLTNFGDTRAALASIGTPQGADFQLTGVNTDGDHGSFDLDMNAGGNFVLTWSGTLPAGSSLHTFVRRYQANGSPLDAAPVLVSSGDEAFDEANPAVALDDSWAFVVVWSEKLHSCCTGSGHIRVQHYAAP